MMALRPLSGAPAPTGPTRPIDNPVAAPSKWSRLFGDDGFSFGDLIDLVNPLQHVPVLGNLYRKISGDLIAPGIRVAGGALFGGPMGALLSAGGLLLERDVDATPDALPDPAPASAIAETGTAQPYRGGWLVNAAMSGQPTPEIPPATLAARTALAAPGVEGRRGGWLVAQAYALDDLATGGGSTLHEKV